MHYDNYNLHCVISIHALLAESDHNARPETRRSYAISIHALLAESDTEAQSLAVTTPISIHALLAESDFSPILKGSAGG